MILGIVEVDFIFELVVLSVLIERGYVGEKLAKVVGLKLCLFIVVEFLYIELDLVVLDERVSEYLVVNFLLHAHFLLKLRFEEGDSWKEQVEVLLRQEMDKGLRRFHQGVSAMRHVYVLFDSEVLFAGQTNYLHEPILFFIKLVYFYFPF